MVLGEDESSPFTPEPHPLTAPVSPSADHLYSLGKLDCACPGSLIAFY
jgi:hypothetical protein